MIAVSLLLLSIGVSTAQTISTVAGGGTGDENSATAVQLDAPFEVAADGLGNIYIAEYGAHRIRKVNGATGLVTTVAGNGTQGFSGDGGLATAAQLDGPVGLAVDGQGNLFISQWNDFRVRKVDTSGGITTVAGSGTAGFSGDGGPATEAQLTYPNGIAVDGQGNLYIADRFNFRIRKVDSGGIISTVAGNGTEGFTGDGGLATEAQLAGPVGVAVDGLGNLYIVDAHRIRKVDSGGVISTVVGDGTAGFSGDGGPATATQLNAPNRVAVDGEGNLYIADSGNSRIRKVDSGGLITTVAGNGTAGFSGDGDPATAAQLNSPSGVALGGEGNLYIADTGNSRIRKVDRTTGLITTVAGGGLLATAAQLSSPAGVAVDGSGNLYIADSGNSRIRKVEAGTGMITTVAGDGTAGFSGDGGPATSARLVNPIGVSVDGSGDLYIADADNNRVRKVAAGTGIITTVAGNGGWGFSGDGGLATGASLASPMGVFVDGSGDLYIADSGNSRVRKVAAGTGIITTVGGGGMGFFSGDGGAATSASLWLPVGIFVDGSGDLYIADLGNHRIRKVTAGTGIITTVVGDGIPAFSGDGGPATSASLWLPVGIFVDGSGDLFIADQFNHRIRKVAAGTGIITTVAGDGNKGFSGDGGLATSASLAYPGAVSVDGSGNLYIADTSNNRVRKVTAAPRVIHPSTETTGPVGAIDDRAPAPPGNLVAVADRAHQEVLLSWTLSADDFVRQFPTGGDFTSGGSFTYTNDVASYQIWRSAQGGDYVLIGTEAAGHVDFVDTSVESGVPYKYVVYAVDRAGNASTPVGSAVVSFESPVAAFTASPTSGPSPLTVQFTDQSTGLVDTYQWDFGDGVTSAERHPSHTYSTAGDYSVSLWVLGPGGAHTSTRASYIAVSTPPVTEPTLAATSATGLGLNFSAVGTGNQADGSAGEGTFSVRFTDKTGVAASGQTITWAITNNGAQKVYLLGSTVVKIDAGATRLLSTWTGADGTASVIFDSEGDKTAGFTSLSVTASTSAPNSDAVSRNLSVAFSVTWHWEAPVDFNGKGTVDFDDFLLFADHFNLVAGDVAFDATFDLDKSGRVGYGDFFIFADNFGRTAEAIVIPDPPGPRPGPFANAAATFSLGSSANLTGVGANQSITVTVVGAGLVGVKQYEVGLEVSPPSAFDLDRADFAQKALESPDGFIFPKSLGIEFPLSGTVKGGAAIFQAAVNGTAELGTFTLYTSASMTAQTEATIRVAHLAVGSSSTEQDLFSASDLGMEIVLNPVPPIAAFTASSTSGTSPLTVQFTDQSTGRIAGWLWDFGDGNTSNAPSPSHLYASAGEYTVSLTVTGPGGRHLVTRTSYVVVSAPAPVSAFTALPTSGQSPLTVRFTDQSTGIVDSYRWVFGDGLTSAVRHPVHVYSDAGNYAVSLTVTGPGGNHKVTRTNYIAVSSPPPPEPTPAPTPTPTPTPTPPPPLGADFEGSPRNGAPGLEVKFTDRSSGAHDLWFWDFGDGGKESRQNPSHTYTSAGTYTVSLEVQNAAGEVSTKSQTNYITIVASIPPTASLALSQRVVVVGEKVVFTDGSTGTITSWLWDFGDGQTSSEQHPSHSYRAPGTFNVSLTVQGPKGSSTQTNVIQVNNSPPVISPALGNVSAAEDSVITLDLTGNETDGQDSGTSLNWTAAILEGAGLLSSFNIEGGGEDVFNFRPQANVSGQVRVRFTLTDLQGASAFQEVGLTWNPRPDPPQVSGPNPADGAGELGLSIGLGWEGLDPDPGEVLTYEVRLGRTSPPDSVIARGLSTAALVLTGLQPQRTYFWQVLARDASGLSTAGPIWRFITAPDRSAPALLAGPSVVGITLAQATVQWTTDETSTSVVEYGLQASLAGALRNEVTAPTLSHAVVLRGLRADTTYYFQVYSADAAGNVSTRNAGKFQTLASADTLEPQILSGPVATGITTTKAIVQWTTDEPSTGSVEYGLRANLAQSLQVSHSELSGSHVLELSGLRADTTYYFRILSRDASNNNSARKAGQFRTLASADTLGPQILSGPLAIGITQAQAIVQWTTDEVSSSVVEYGLTSGLGLVRQQKSPDLNHEVLLPNLQADTTYFYRISSMDPSGNASRFRQGTFRTLAFADTVAPNILTGPVVAGKTNADALIKWTTDEPSDSRVDFGLNPDLSAAQEVESGALVTLHAAVLTNLQAQATYYFQVRSADANHNLVQSRPVRFQTLAASDTLPPVIITGPVAVGITNQSAQLQWETDEEARAQVDFGIAGTEHRLEYLELYRQQSIVLTNLLPATTYKYRITTTDLSGNQRRSRPYTFTTQTNADTLPPVLTAGPVVTTRLHNKAVIEWSTDEESDGEVAFGSTAAYDRVVRAPGRVKGHQVQLTNLSPGQTYYFEVRSVDASGNGPVRSRAMTFGTLARPDTLPPRITAAPIVLERNDRSARITWATDELASGVVEYGPDANLGLTAGNEEAELVHRVRMTNLKPATTYRYRVLSTDVAGNGPTTNSGELAFTTRAAPDTLPPVMVTDPFVIASTRTSVTIQWVTDEPADSRVRYGLAPALDREQIRPEYVKVHTVDLSNLSPAARYQFEVGSTDPSDNGPTTSQVLSFRTSADQDTRPPVLLRAPTARSITSTSANIEWSTDEPSNSVVDYGTSVRYGTGHLEQGERVQDHVVSITGLQPAATYHCKVSSADISGNTVSTDPAGNSPHSLDYTFRTLAAEDVSPPIFLEGPVIYARDQGAVVEWTTDEPARYELVYDIVPTLNSARREVLQGNELKKRQAAEFGRLVRGTVYYYRLTVWDQSNNQQVATTGGGGGGLGKVAKLAQPPGGGGSFVTLQQPDTQFPVILSQPRVTAKTASSLTIEWTTDERSDSKVDFGLGGQLDQQGGSPYDELHHQVVLSQLRPGQSYGFQTGSTDPSGNGATRSAKLVARTETELDLVPPQFLGSPKVVLLTDRLATIEWTTDELSTSVVEFGKDKLAAVREDPELTSRHRITLTNLTPKTTYGYKVYSRDASNNGPMASAELTFQTDAAPDLQAPQIVKTPQVITKSNTTMTAIWETDEPADSFIEYGPGAAQLDGLSGSPEMVQEHRLTLTNLRPQTTYYYRVGSIDQSHNGPAKSPVYRFETDAHRDSLAPAAPAGVVVRAGSGAVGLSWKANTEPDLGGYNVYRRVAGGPLELVASQLQTTAFVDKGLKDEVAYAYQLTAVDQATPPNESVLSARATGTPSPQQALAAPVARGMRAGPNAATATIANVRAAGIGTVLTYTFQVSTTAGFTDLVAGEGRIPSGRDNTTAWTFTRPLALNTEYWWRARASDGVFEGPWMVPASFQVVGVVGDFDGSGRVTFDDFFLFADNFGLNSSAAEWNPVYDLSGNSSIDFDDFFLFADNFGKGVEASSPKVFAENGGNHGIQPHLRLVSLTPQRAVVALEIDSPVPLSGVGAVLRHEPGVEIQFPAPEIRTHEGARFLEGVLARTEGRTSVGRYQLSGESSPATTLWELAFTLAPEMVGSQITIEELWVSDHRHQRTRLGETAQVQLVPQAYTLGLPYPNPFNPTVQIPYALPEKGGVSIRIYNILGQQTRMLAKGIQEAGFYQVVWDGRDESGQEAGSGLYFVRVEIGLFRETRKVILLR